MEWKQNGCKKDRGFVKIGAYLASELGDWKIVNICDEKANGAGAAGAWSQAGDFR